VTAIAVERADLRHGGAWTRRQRFKNDALYAIARGALAIAERAPRFAVVAFARGLGAIAYAVLARERRLARARLAAATGARVPERRVLAAFLAAGDALADTVALLDPRERAGRSLALDQASREAFRGALAEGRGVVYVAAHLGPWERMAALLVEEGFPVATVARESYDPRFTRLYDRLRAPRGVRGIYRGRPGAAAAIVRELRAGRAVGFLVDIPSRVRSVPARLFGAEADVPVGAAKIALARGAAVVVGTPAPGPSGALDRVLVERVPTADLAPGPEGEQALTRRLALALEARIAARPEAWLGLFAPPRRAPDATPELRRRGDPR
jgi:Kdo2-lipid IVA lauroyltransferase/acyltransferase